MNYWFNSGVRCLNQWFSPLFITPLYEWWHWKFEVGIVRLLIRSLIWKWIFKITTPIYFFLTKFGPWGVIEPLIPSSSLDQIIALIFWILNIWQEIFQFYKHTFSSNSVLAFLCWNIILTSTRLRKKIEPMC